MHADRLTEKQKFWTHHLHAQRNSGLTRKKYCEQHSFKLDHMHYYASLLQKKARKEDKSADGFVRLTSVVNQ